MSTQLSICTGTLRLFPDRGDGERRAVFSPCGKYRYLLVNKWASGPVALWGLLNPSYATADADDPTATRVWGFSRSFGCGAAWIVNPYAFITSDPREMRRAVDPVGPDNHAIIADAVSDVRASGGIVIAAWGRGVRSEDDLATILRLLGSPLHCLGMNKDGSPKHPLYLRADTKLVAYPLRATPGGDREP